MGKTVKEKKCRHNHGLILLYFFMNTTFTFLVIVLNSLVFLFNVGLGFFLCNVGEICALSAFAATSYYQKISRSKITIEK